MTIRENVTIKLTVYIITLGLCYTCFGAIIYVDADSAGGDNGSSWVNAYHFLQDALDDANNGDAVKYADKPYV